jgi:hypothetical protein
MDFIYVNKIEETSCSSFNLGAEGAEGERWQGWFNQCTM